MTTANAEVKTAVQGKSASYYGLLCRMVSYYTLWFYTFCAIPIGTDWTNTINEEQQ